MSIPTREFKSYWSVAATAAAGLLVGVVLTGLAWTVSMAVEQGNDKDFASICAALDGHVWGQDHDVCADDTNKIILLDKGATP